MRTNEKGQRMKKAISWILILAVAGAVACAGAEAADPFFSQLTGIEWSFSSGAGAWSTDMRILPDGTFSGEYHDGELGESTDDYPDGTIYCCSFTGRMSFAGQLDEFTCKLRVDELKTEEKAGEETIADGMRFITAEPYGISAGDEMLLFRPGTPVNGFSDDMQMWAHLSDQEESADTLEAWFLWSDKNESGFVGFPVENTASAVNPWTDMTQEQLQAVSGVSFSVPEGAENVIWRWLGSEGLAEMQFTWNGDEFCARAQAAALEEGQLMEISGMYFAWDYEEEITVGECPGTIGLAQTGSEDWAERCLWYDQARGIMHSLSVCTIDPDGLDLTAVAAQVFQPAGVQ